MLTYYGTLVPELSHKEDQLRKQIWDDYGQRMVSHKGDARRYPLRRTIAWLGWLARQMRENNQAIFFLELIRLAWLPKGQRAFYRWSVGLLFGLLFGLSEGHGDDLFIVLVVWCFIGLLFVLGGGLYGGLFVGLPGELLKELLTERRTFPLNEWIRRYY